MGIGDRRILAKKRLYKTSMNLERIIQGYRIKVPRLSEKIIDFNLTYKIWWSGTTSIYMWLDAVPGIPDSLFLDTLGTQSQTE